VKYYEHLVELVTEVDSEILPEHIEEALQEGYSFYGEEWDEQVIGYFWPRLMDIADQDVETKLQKAIFKIAREFFRSAFADQLLDIKKLTESQPVLFERSNLQKEYDALQAERAAEDTRREAEEKERAAVRSTPEGQAVWWCCELAEELYYLGWCMHCERMTEAGRKKRLS
jgi:hypothetical protein